MAIPAPQNTIAYCNDAPGADLINSADGSNGAPVVEQRPNPDTVPLAPALDATTGAAVLTDSQGETISALRAANASRTAPGQDAPDGHNHAPHTQEPGTEAELKYKDDLAKFEAKERLLPIDAPNTEVLDLATLPKSPIERAKFANGPVPVPDPETERLRQNIDALDLANLPQSPIERAKAANWPELQPEVNDQVKKVCDINRKSEVLSAKLAQLKASSMGPGLGAKTGAVVGTGVGVVALGVGGAIGGVVLGTGLGAVGGAIGWLINKVRQLFTWAEHRANKSQLDKASKALGKLMNGKVEERLGFLTRLQDGAKQLGPSVRDAFLTTLGASGSDLARWAGQRLKEAEVKKAAEAKKAATSQLAIEPSALPAPPVEASSVAGDRDSREYSFTGLHNPGYV